MPCTSRMAYCQVLAWRKSSGARTRRACKRPRRCSSQRLAEVVLVVGPPGQLLFGRRVTPRFVGGVAPSISEYTLKSLSILR